MRAPARNGNRSASVSVVIPCFNHGHFLAEAIDSALAQIHPCVEVIVVDDGSTDDTRDIARGYGAKVKYFWQPNQGLAAARNTGLANAQGQFIVFLDADDLLLPGMVSEALRSFEASPSADVVYTPFIFANSDLSDRSWIVAPVLDAEPFLTLAHENPFACQCMLFRSSALHGAGEFDRELTFGEDWDMWQRMARQGVRWTSLPVPLSIVRMRPGSMSRDPLEMIRCTEKILRRAHTPDPRVAGASTGSAVGCPCTNPEPLWQAHLAAVSRCLAQGQLDTAFSVLDDWKGSKRVFGIRDVEAIFSGLWLATATPRGDWATLWPRIRGPLFDFLLRQEERVQQSGFAARMLSRLVQRAWLPPEEALQDFCGRVLLRAAVKRVQVRLSGG